MINPKYVNDLLLFKENISSGGGFFSTSMAPCIGGPSHGALVPVENLGHISMSDDNIYKKSAILIDCEEGEWNAIYIFKYENSMGTSILDDECERILEALAMRFNIEFLESL